MTDDKRDQTVEALARRLVQETGISEAQALNLILLLGMDWSSLVREARVLKKVQHLL